MSPKTKTHAVPHEERSRKKTDPVLHDQGGRMMPVDPLGTNITREEKVRLRAFELYVQRGRRDGHADEHWLQAESEIAHD